MSQGFFRLFRTTDDGKLKRLSQTTAFGTAGVSVTQKAGRIYKVTVHNTGAVAHFVQIHDKATAPVGTDVPIWEERLPASSSVTFVFDEGLYVALGFGLAVSTTPAVFTVSAANDSIAYAQYAS